MPLFEYTAIDASGRHVKGSLDADNVRVARQKLRAQQIFPTDIKEGTAEATRSTKDVKQYFQSNRTSLKDLSVMTRQLSTLVTAGLPLVSSLQALAEQTDNGVLRRVLISVREDIEQGATFARALAKYPKSFPALYVNLIASGEASGTLDTVLENLADYLEAQVELRRKIYSALTYPIVMMILCILVIAGLLVFVIPKVVDIFIKQGAVLPLPTRIVLALSGIVTNYWLFILIALGLSWILFNWYYERPDGRSVVDRLLLRLPMFGPVYVKINTSRISATLSTLLSSGVGLLTAIDISRNITANVHVAKALEDARAGVQEGKSLSRELARAEIFPSLLCHMIAVGEKSGELESMLQKASRAYESEVNATLNRLTSLLEPLMMIFVGMVVLLIVIAVLLPMADMIDIIQK